MRKLSAILLIAVFALSQYARHLSYLECKLSNAFKSPEFRCDCEKQAGFDKEKPEPAAPKTHLHIHIDEYFASPKQNLLPPVNKNPGQLFPCFYTKKECKGNYSIPWQPPNS